MRVIRRALYGCAVVFFALGCATGRSPAPRETSRAAREVRVAIDYGNAPGPRLDLMVGPGADVRGALYARLRLFDPGLSDSLTALIRTHRGAYFASVACTHPLQMAGAEVCQAQFPRGAPNWVAVLREVDAALSADAVAERESVLAPMTPLPGALIRIRGCNDACLSVHAEMRDGTAVRARRLSDGAARRVEQMVDSLMAMAGDGRVSGLVVPDRREP